MTEEQKATPRESLEFEISNAIPRIGTINGQLIQIERIKLSGIRDAWVEVITIFQAYQVLAAKAIRSDGGGALRGTAATDGSEEEEPISNDADVFLEQLKKLGPDVVNVLHTFIQTSCNISNETLAGMDFWSTIELTIMILEHNIGPELKGFFDRGGSALKSLGLWSDPPATKQNSVSSIKDGPDPISGNSGLVN